MCGIFCVISCDTNPDAINHYQEIEPIIKRRGPDQHQTNEFHNNNFYVKLSAWVLHMQGFHLTPQPATANSGNILLFNGEVFCGIKVSLDKSDTSVLLDNLSSCQTNKEIRKVFERIEGPWSIIFYHAPSKTLWFGRDYFGRRSLLISLSSGQLMLSSVAKTAKEACAQWDELVPGLYSVDLSLNPSDPFNFSASILSYPWTSIITNECKSSHFDISVATDKELWLRTPIITHQLKDAVGSTSITSQTRLSPFPSPSLLQQLIRACDEKSLWSKCEQLIEVLSNALRKRTKVLDTWNCDCKVGVLFSGGIDCSVLAILAHKFVPLNEPIDLLNVAFEHSKQISKLCNKTNKGHSRTPEVDYLVPDRVTGISSFKELCSLCPERRWNFIEINVPTDELRKQRIEHISHLIYPKDTVLDDSIACALWFASRGKGIVKAENGVYKPYTSTARILLCGMGADEQLGGYSRHRSAFDVSQNWSDVDKLLQMEIERISSRNLGRDDRIISDHGREGRYPYLDEEVVAFLSLLPTNQKADYSYCRGIGEKILLRGAAYLLGFRETPVLPKRAIQFGSRIAKAEFRGEKGGDKCLRLTNSATYA